MSLTPGQVTFGTLATFVTVMPPGPCAVVLSNLSTANTVYVGIGTAVTATNGFPITPTTSPVTIPGFNGSAGGSLYALASGSPATVGFVVSAASGGTGT